MASEAERQLDIAIAVRNAARVVAQYAEQLESTAGIVAIDLYDKQEPVSMYEAIGKLAVAQDALNVALAGYEAP
jgi:anti-sigma regulatory factor (Ser/Thr protein kinase)